MHRPSAASDQGSLDKIMAHDMATERAAASQHRQAAFEAAEFLMDYLKTSAPFWKREEKPDGTNWVEARDHDDAAAARWNRS